jgi:hypothetical protein
MPKLTATYNGKTFSRNTERDYQYAVAITHAEVKPWHKGEADGIVAWCGDFAKAQAAAKKYSKPQWGFCRVEIVGVQK